MRFIMESTEKLDQLPNGLTFPDYLPDSLKGIIDYDCEKKILIFRGVMTECQKEKLLSLCKKKQNSKAYKNAIESLFHHSSRDNDITNNNKDSALAQYAQLSNEWVLHCSDKWKFLFIIFVVHGSVYALFYTPSISLDKRLTSSFLIFLIVMIILMVYSACKSDAYARRITHMKQEIARHPIVLMPFIEVVLREEKEKKRFRRKSTMNSFLVVIFSLMIFDIIYLYLLWDP